MNGGRPTRVVQLALMGALLGVALPGAVEATVENASWGLVLLCLGYILQALLFFHGKIATLEDEDYTRLLSFQPRLALFDFAANLGIILLFVVMSALFDELVILCAANVAMRLLDLALVVKVRSVSLSDAVRRAQGSWLTFDLVSIIVWLTTMAIIDGRPLDEQTPIVGCVFFGLIAADIVMDYTYNRDLYFGRAAQWDAMADLWDDTQGAHGDTTRREIVIPALLRAIGRPGARILDVGCGNGAVSRALAAAGHDVVGIDSSPSMIGHARSYTAPAVEYRVADLTSDELELAGFDVCVFCFSQQDAHELEPCWELAERCLRPGGQLLMVFELLEVIEHRADHTMTTRRWLQRTADGHDGRKQLVIWGEAQAYATETTIYRTETYTRCAGAHGFERVVAAPLPWDEGEDSTARRRYRAHPRFGLLSCIRP